MASVASWIAACKGIGVDRVLKSIWGRAEEGTAEWVDSLSELDAGGGVVYRAQMILSAVSDCIRVSVLCCPYTVSGIPAILCTKIPTNKGNAKKEMKTDKRMDWT